jgi:putative colanic acid biosynthesis acetyltransferase WcaF
MTPLKTDLSKFSNNWYKPGAGIVKRALWYWVNLVFFKSAFPFYGVKKALLKLFGAKVGTGFVIKPFVNIKYPWNLIIENNVWIGEEVWIDNLALVTLKSNSCVSQGALLLCGNHNYKKTTFDLIVGEIILEEGAWAGAKSIVCGGVTVGSHSVLTAGSTATQSIEEYFIYQGNPAVKVKPRLIEG